MNKPVRLRSAVVWHCPVRTASWEARKTGSNFQEDIMIKQTVIAASVFAAAVFAFQPQQAQAGTNVQVHIGVPSVGYYGHRRHYQGRRHYTRPAYRHPSYYRVGCHQARRMLRHRGFRDIRTYDCHGSRYVFKAFRHGHWWMVRMSSNTGRVLGVHAI